MKAKKSYEELCRESDERAARLEALFEASPYRDQAIAELEKLPPSPARQALADLADYIVERTK